MTAPVNNAQVGQDKVTGGVVIIGGIFIVTLLAGISEDLGRILVIIMAGFLLIWLMTGGSNLLSKWMGKEEPYNLTVPGIV
jgi:VIT1/CCC1 family predicted Fe2+/Mn2+ transporter